MTDGTRVPRSPALARTAGKIVDLSAFVNELPAGERVFLPGSAGEPIPLMSALCAGGGQPLNITTSFVPGINSVPMTRLPSGTKVACMFAHADLSEAQRGDQFRHIPLTYAGFAAALVDDLVFDTCFVHVAPPDTMGNCSLGAAVEFTPLAARRSRRRVALINSMMPSIPGAESMALDQFDAVIECDAPLREYHAGAVSKEAQRIASNVASYVENGVALQIGLGKAPDALLRTVADRKNLRLHSGMLSDGVMALDAAGALDPSWTHTSCVHVGSAEYYAWLKDRSGFAVRNCSVTHALALLTNLPRLVAVNSALTVDLFGQANLESIDGRMISGVGGASDFARGAAMSPGGVSIVALPATSRNGENSRIVTVLEGLCSIPRTDVDVVVTEHGAADLRGCSVIARARRLIDIAAPDHRATLESAFHAVAKRL